MKQLKNNPKIRKNFSIEILKYANEKIEFTENQLKNDLTFNNAETQWYFGHLRHNKSLLEHLRNGTLGKEDMWTISSEGQIRLLEYLEFEEAKKSSRDAKILAIIAIIISVLLALASI